MSTQTLANQRKTRRVRPLAKTTTSKSGPRAQRLAGGWGGCVYKIGGTVRRDAGPWTPAVHELLVHLESRGFSASPRVLGVNKDGSEVLTFIDGNTCGGPSGWPDWARSERYLTSVGRLIRSFHDAVSDFKPTKNVWRAGRRELRDGEIIGHNDISLANLVAGKAGRVHGLIDWDQAGPTTPRRELAYAAWHVVGLHAPAHTAARGWTSQPDIARRIRLFVDAYGLTDREGFVDEIISRLHEIIRDVVFGSPRNPDHAIPFVEMLAADILFISSNRAVLEEALTATAPEAMTA